MHIECFSMLLVDRIGFAAIVVVAREVPVPRRAIVTIIRDVCSRRRRARMNMYYGGLGQEGTRVMGTLVEIQVLCCCHSRVLRQCCIELSSILVVRSRSSPRVSIPGNL